MPNGGRVQNGNSPTENSGEENISNAQAPGNFDPSNMPNGGRGGMPGMGPNANTDEESHFVWTKNEIILASVIDLNQQIYLSTFEFENENKC